MTGGKARRWFDVVPLFATVVITSIALMVYGWEITIYYLVGGLEPFFAFPYIGNSHPN